MAKNKDPYFWVSEIMLQQTQVSTVIPFYIKFIDRFQTINQLAEASEDEVMSYWSGLGFIQERETFIKLQKLFPINILVNFQIYLII